jgi:RND family efflux transporter MFP subunit
MEGAMNPYQRARAAGEAAPGECRVSEALRRRNGWLCLAFLIGITTVITGCGDKVKPGTAEVKRPVISGVTVSEVRPTKVDEYYETSGTVKARTTSVIASRVMGTVTSLAVKEGDRVRAGQVLMTIDDRDSAQRVKAAEKAVEAAQENLSLADITYQRYRKLFDGKALTQQEIDQIGTQRRVAEIELERAEAVLAEARVVHGFTRITAPAEGVVTEKKTDAGTMATPGTALLTLEDTSSFTFEAAVSEGFAGKIRTGTPVDVTIDALGKPVQGRIVEIVPSVDPQSRTFMVKAGVSGEGLKTGLSGKIRIPIGEREALVVPAKAVIERGQLTGVYAVDEEGVVTYRLIRMGKKHRESVEALSGIRAGDRIVTDGVDRASDGGIIKQ